MCGNSILASALVFMHVMNLVKVCGSSILASARPIPTGSRTTASSGRIIPTRCCLHALVQAVESASHQDVTVLGAYSAHVIYQRLALVRVRKQLSVRLPRQVVPHERLKLIHLPNAKTIQFQQRPDHVIGIQTKDVSGPPVPVVESSQAASTPSAPTS